MHKPELLAPAGDMDCLVSAIEYGADAVYLGMKQFGMRDAPVNFDRESLKKAVTFAHNKGARVYVTCNTLPRNDELAELPQFFEEIEECGADALIIADIGVMQLAKKYAPNTEIHISTQAGIVNYQTAQTFYDLGAKRVVLARELSLTEIAEIKRRIPKELEIECFVHGAMCMSFSGRCLISQYLNGRDANRGKCSQPCRWKYHVVEEKRPGEYFALEESSQGTHIFNSRDMCLIEHLPELSEAGIDSLKIEGRAKTAFYSASVTNAYRNAIDWHCQNDGRLPQWIIDETDKISHRAYCTGFFFGSPLQEYENGGYIRNSKFIGTVDESRDGRLYITQRNRFCEGDEIEILRPNGRPQRIKAEDMRNADGEKIEAAPHAQMKLSIKYDGQAQNGWFIRMDEPAAK